MSAEDRRADAQDGAKGGEQGPAAQTPGPNPSNVITAGGVDAAKAYVPPTALPKGREPTKPSEVVKVDIADKRALELLDPRKAVTQKMSLPPGGLRPPPPAAEGVMVDAAASPWSQSGGLDRTALPSAALTATAAPKPAAAARAPEEKKGGGTGLWVGVILGAVVLGGGLAFVVKKASAPPKPTSTTPIAVTVTQPPPGTLPLPAPAAEPTADPDEAPTAAATEAPTAAPTEAPTAEATAAPTATATSSALAAEEAPPMGLAPTAAPTVASTGVRVPTTKATAKATATSAPTAAPTATTTTKKRLFD